MSSSDDLNAEWRTSSGEHDQEEVPRRRYQRRQKWTPEDHLKFLAGLEQFGLQRGLGPGGAELMSAYMGNRDILQIKSHMQRHLSDKANKLRGARRTKPCSRCRKKKLKCDGNSPCTSCIKAGEHCDALEAEKGHQDMLESRSCDKDALKATTSTAVEGTSLACGGRQGSRYEQSYGKLVPVSKQYSTVGHPEHPLSFPASIRRAPMDCGGDPQPERPSLLSWLPLQLFSNYRISPCHAENLLLYSTPRLRSTLLRIFAKYESTFERPASRTPQVPSLPQDPGYDGVLSSSRCGFHSLWFDLQDFRVQACSGNRFWTDLAGMHREEFLTRAMNQDLKPFSSELRIVCRLLFLLEKVLRFRLGLSPEEELSREEVIYGRMTKHWACSGGDRSGVVTRLRIKRSFTGTTLHCRWSCVVLSPAEYDLVAQRHPELCEPLASEVTGAMSAAQLAGPSLEQDEAFQSLAATEDGRKKLDRLADCLERKYAWFFDYDAGGAKSEPPTEAPAQLPGDEQVSPQPSSGPTQARNSE